MYGSDEYADDMSGTADVLQDGDVALLESESAVSCDGVEEVCAGTQDGERVALYAACNLSERERGVTVVQLHEAMTCGSFLTAIGCDPSNPLLAKDSWGLSIVRQLHASSCELLSDYLTDEDLTASDIGRALEEQGILIRIVEA